MAKLAPADCEVTLQEREQCLEAIEQVLDSAANGDGAVLGLVGEAGLGKTTLLARSVRRAEALGFRAGSARGESAESTLPYGLLQQAATSLGDPRRFEGLAASSPVEPNARRFYATSKWLEERSTEPLLLAIDDLHWADPDSLALIGFLCRRLAGLRVAIIVTLRPWPAQAADLLGALSAGGPARLESLVSLSERACAQILEERLGAAPEAAIVQRAWSLCAGNPLLLEQVADAMTEGLQIPQGSSAELRKRFLLKRFTGVTAQALRYAQAASVFGPDFRLSVVAGVAELTNGQADAALTALSASGLLGAGGPGWGRFRHPLLCQALYDDIAPALRAGLHARAFEALLAVDVAAGECAPHAVRAGLVGDQRAVEVLAAAGRDALRAGATATGRAHLTAAVEVAGSGAAPDLLLSVAQARMADGDLTGAAELGTRVLATAGVARGTAVQAHWELGRAAMFAGQDARGEEHFQAAAEVAALSDPDLAAQVLLDGAMMRWMARGPRASMAAAQRARELARSARTRAEAAAVWAQAALMEADPAGLEALDSVGRLPAPTATEPLPDFLISGGPQLAFLFAAKIVERFEAALHAFGVSHSGAERAGSPLAIGLCLVTHADTLTRLGRLAEALELLERAGRLADFSVLVAPWAAIGRAHVLLELGHPEESKLQCAGVEALLGAFPDRFPLLRLWLWRVLADLEFTEGDVEGACERLGRLEALARASAIIEPCIVPWHGLAVRAYLASGRIEEIARLADELDRITAQLPCRWPRAVAAHARALVAEHSGDRGAAREHFEAGLAHLAAVPMPLAQAELDIAFGGFLRRGGERREARQRLHRARDVARAAGAGRCLIAAETELSAVGGRESGPSAPALTAQEQRVAALAAVGLSNKQLAARLNITPKTVSNHLEHIYHKLGIHSRRELMTARPGIGSPTPRSTEARQA